MLNGVCRLGVVLIVFAAGDAAAAARAPADFEASIGINTHVYALNTAYGDLPAVLNALAYLGIRHVRDNLPRAGTPDRYLALEQAGIGLDLVARSNTEPALSFYEPLASGLDGIEGPNEVNAHPNSFVYHGVAQIPGALLLQHRLYDAVKTDVGLSAVPVVAFSTVYHGPADLPPYNAPVRADLANVHAYADGAAVPPDVYLARDIARSAAAVPGAPVLVTEFGYFTLPDAPHAAGVDDETQAQWTLDALADNFFRDHVERQYIYELVDQLADEDAPNKEHHFGLFDVGWQPKPAALALHDLNRLLQAPGASGAAPALTMGGLPAGAHEGLLQTGGTLFVLLWNEAAAPAPVTLHFANAPAQIAVFDPLRGMAALQVLRRAGSVSFPLGPDLIVVEAGA